MRPRIYIDTSVIGGYYDEEFEEPTKKLFARIANKYTISQKQLPQVKMKIGFAIKKAAN